MTIYGQFFYITYTFSFFLKVDPKCIYLEEKILLNHLNSVFLGHTKVTNGHRMYLDGDGKRKTTTTFHLSLKKYISKVWVK